MNRNSDITYSKEMIIHLYTPRRHETFMKELAGIQNTSDNEDNSRTISPSGQIAYTLHRQLEINHAVHQHNVLTS